LIKEKEKIEREIAQLSAQIRNQQKDKEAIDVSLSESDSLEYNNEMSSNGQETNPVGASASISKKSDHSSSIFDKDGVNQVNYLYKKKT
jgi:hypothetical protein